MDIADTNIVSTFARVDSIPLLLDLLKVDRIYVTAATYHELRKAVKVGCDFLKPVVDAIATGVPIDLIELSRQEILTTNSLPDSLGPGEAESIAACIHRQRTSLLTNDKRARNLCREPNLPCRDLLSLEILCLHPPNLPSSLGKSPPLRSHGIDGSVVRSRNTRFWLALFSFRTKCQSNCLN